MKLLLIQGANMEYLGIRQPELYGTTTAKELNSMVRRRARDLGVDLEILYTNTAVYIGIVYSYLPFMVLPLYAALEKTDHALLEAASDLGAPPLRTFWSVTFPLSLPGVIAGSLLCFIPAVGEFIIPDLMGGSETLMIGKTLWTEFFVNRSWTVSSAAAIVLLMVLIAPILILCAAIWPLVYARVDKLRLEYALEFARIMRHIGGRTAHIEADQPVEAGLPPGLRHADHAAGRARQNGVLALEQLRRRQPARRHHEHQARGRSLGVEILVHLRHIAPQNRR